MPPVRGWLLIVLATAATGCGARTTIDETRFVDVVPDTLVDAPLDTSEDSSDTSETSDVEDTLIPDTFVPDTEPVDTFVPDTTDTSPEVFVECRSALECDDKIACTEDICRDSVCFHEPKSDRCDNGIFCDGEESCAVGIGCVTTPRNCVDRIDCTVDSCDEGSKSCVSVPNDWLCPVSFGCDLVLGCQARALAHSSTTVYEVRLPSGEVRPVGSSDVSLSDIALSPDGTLTAVSGSSLCTLDFKAGRCNSVRPSGFLNALDYSRGLLLGAGGTFLYQVDPMTGALTTNTPFPPGLSSSGDLAVLAGARVLGSATGSPDGQDRLVEFNLTTRTAKVLGSIGFSCVWGLAAYGKTLFGLTCEGRVLSIDPDTGKALQLTRVPGVQFWGATAR